MSGIFISYRRSDNPDATGRIYDRLVAEFGKAAVFKDVDSIPLGRDFRGHLNDIVSNCGVMLAIIGPTWIDARSKAGQRRLDDADDFVRIELEAALARDIPVVPVLVGHAPIPLASELPASLASMAFRQSIEVRPDPDFHNDVTRLVLALRGILDPTGAVAEQAEQAAAAITTPATTETKSSRRLGWIAFAAAVLVAAVLAIPALKHLRETPPPEIRTSIDTPSTLDPGGFSLSPDGRQIVFVASGDGASRLWLRPLATTTAQPLAGTEGASYPFWSPDNRSIGFFADGTLKRLDLGGGAPQTLASAPFGSGGTWNAQGVILFGPSQVSLPLMRVPANGGEAREATALTAKQSMHRAPFFLPDGHRFLFVALGSPDTEGIYLGDLAGGAPTRLTNVVSQPVYMPAGWLLWRREGTLVAQRLDVTKAALTGAPITLVSTPMQTVGAIAVSVAATGLVAYRAVESTDTQLTWFDRSGVTQGTVGDPDGSLHMPRVAPDGRRIAVLRSLQGARNVWLLDGSRLSRLTSGATSDLEPTWSPDGTQIVYGSTRTGRVTIYQKLLNGVTGDEHQMVPNDMRTGEAPSSWSKDGHFVLITNFNLQSDADILVMPMTGDHTLSDFVKTPFHEAWGVFSPDGRWVAYQSNQSGRKEIYVRTFHPPGAKDSDAASVAVQWQVSSAGGISPTWRPDGKEIFYLDPAGAMMAAPITVYADKIAPDAPVKLFQTKIVGGGVHLDAPYYDVAPDGRFLIDTVLDSAAAPITLIQNWNPEAKTH